MLYTTGSFQLLWKQPRVATSLLQQPWPSVVPEASRSSPVRAVLSIMLSGTFALLCEQSLPCRDGDYGFTFPCGVLCDPYSPTNGNQMAGNVTLEVLVSAVRPFLPQPKGFCPSVPSTSLEILELIRCRIQKLSTGQRNTLTSHWWGESPTPGTACCETWYRWAFQSSRAW